MTDHTIIEHSIDIRDQWVGDEKFLAYAGKQNYERLIYSDDFNRRILSGRVYAVKMSQTKNDYFDYTDRVTKLTLRAELTEAQTMQVVVPTYADELPVYPTTVVLSDAVAELRRRGWRAFGYKFRGWRRECNKWFLRFERAQGMS